MSYSYSLSTYFSDGINIHQFKNRITENTAITTTLNEVILGNGNVNTIFQSTLSAGEKTALDTLVTNYIYKLSLPNKPLTIEVIVSKNDRESNYLSIADAFNDGNLYVYVKNGTYVETEDIVIPTRGQLIGESQGLTIIALVAGNSVKSDGSGGVKETAGTIAITQNTTTVTGTGTTFTNLSAGDFILLGNSFYEIDATPTVNTSLELTGTYRGKTLSGEPYLAQSMHTGVTIRNCIISSSSGTGLYLRAQRHGTFDHMAVTQCTPNIEFVDSADNTLNTIVSSDGTGVGVTITNCYELQLCTINVFQNTSHGFQLDGTSNCLILDTCSATSNGGAGYNVVGSSQCISLTDCIAKQNVGDGYITGSSSSTSILASSRALDNGENGFNISGTNDSISDCIIAENTNDGVLSAGDSIIEGNQCLDNGGNGIKITGGDSTVSDNRCMNNSEDGIYCSGDNNVLASNRCKGNTQSGLELISGATSNIVSGNHLGGNTGTNYVDGGTSTVATGNITA